MPSPSNQKSHFHDSAAKGDVKKPGAAAAEASSSMQFIPAISDADGPEPRPYADDLKPEEEQKLRKKILSLAAMKCGRARHNWRLRRWDHQRQLLLPDAKRAKLPQPSFEEVQLRVFDLSTARAVLVLTTKARMPARPCRRRSAIYRYAGGSR